MVQCRKVSVWGHIKEAVKEASEERTHSKNKCPWDRQTPVRELLVHLGEPVTLVKRWISPPINIKTLGQLVQVILPPIYVICLNVCNTVGSFNYHG